MAMHQARDERRAKEPAGILAKVPMSGAVSVSDKVFVSYRLGVDASGAIVSGDIAEPARIYLTDFTGFADHNGGYQRLSSAPIATASIATRVMAGTPQPALGAEMEIEAVAVRRTT